MNQPLIPLPPVDETARDEITTHLRMLRIGGSTSIVIDRTNNTAGGKSSIHLIVAVKI